MKSINLSYVLATLLTLIVIAGSARLSSAAPLKQTTDPVAVLTAFEQIIGSPQDVDTALAMFADNATLKITPAPQGTSGLWTGRDEIRQGLDYAVAHKVQHTLNGSPQVNGNTVAVATLTTNDFFQRLGVAPVQFQTEAVIENGKITTYSTTIAPAEGRRVAAAAAAQGTQPTATQPQQTSDPASVVTNFERMIGNGQDTDAALALYADNAVQKIIPAPQGTSGSWSGKAELRQALDYAVAHKVQHTLEGSPQVDGNNVTASALVTNDAFQHLGVAPVKFQITAVVEGGKMTTYTATIMPAEKSRVAAAAAAQASAGNQPMLPKTGSSMASDLDSWGLLLGTVAFVGGLLLLALHRHQHSLLTRR